ncbi:hypothetical protein LXA43DRAFT_917078 [Ganoderma leucocontextum]|nr:hypothetical protein LXA43DRAFT_917078 [Ganoderma leucocontextum]
MFGHHVPTPPNNAPCIPSPVETKFYLYGLPSGARMIARSSADVWMQPPGPEAYLEPKELAVLGAHRLNDVWEDVVGPAMDTYLLGQQVKCSVMHPLRLGIAGQPSPPAVIMIGVNHDSLSAESGLQVAVHCRSILLDNQIEDVHVIVYESKYQLLAGMYKPAITANPVAIVREPFSTTLGIPICNAKTTNIAGTGGIFFVDTTKPGKLFLLTARHVLFHPDEEENKLYRFRENSEDPMRKVMFMGEVAFKNRCGDIEAAVGAKQIVIAQLQRRLEAADSLDEDDAILERNAVITLMAEANSAITAFQKLHTDVLKSWAEVENRVIGHVTLSPPITLNHADSGFTEDWAVVEILPSMISKLNFIGNAIDLGSIEVDELTAWMYPHNDNPHSFEYPGDRLLRFFGTVSDAEMYKPNSKTMDQDNDPVIMVLKNGNTTNLTVGRLNTIRAFTRTYFKGEPGEMSKEIAVLPRTSKSGPFSDKGDSGSVVVDGKGRVCGILTGGDGAADVSDCAFVTSINFIIKRSTSTASAPTSSPCPPIFERRLFGSANRRLCLPLSRTSFFF